MSGHSRWANIKHKKAREDARKGKVFTKLIREITVAARNGGDPESNPRLRTAIEKARAENIPAENIERAIRRGTGEVEGGVNYEECTYEGYGPGGVAVFVEIMTDNRNRTASDIRHIFAKHGGSLGESGCVAWNFEKKGIFTFDYNEVDEDILMEMAIEAGAEDIKALPEEGIFEVYTEPSDFHRVKEAFDKKGLRYTVAEITMLPKTTVRITGSEAERMLRLMDALEDCDDVQNVSANFDIPSQEMDNVIKTYELKIKNSLIPNS